MNLFIVSSPFQALSAISAKNKFKSTHNTIIVRNSANLRNNEQLKRILELASWEKIVEIKNSQFNLIKYLLVIRKYSRQKIDFQHIFIGDYRVPENLLAFSNINGIKKILLDDGGVTITVQNVFFNNLSKFKKDYLSKFYLLRILLYKILGLKMYEVRVLDVFTCFKLTPKKNQTIILNDFSYVRKMLNLEQSSSDRSTVYFLGTSMVENGFISLEYYLEYMKNISAYYKKLNKKVLYIQHRIESTSKLALLKNRNLEILRFENPVELEFIYRKIVPINIASFFSTALYTLKVIYKTVDIDAFLIDSSKINPKHIEHVSACYKFNSKFVNEISF